MLIKKITNAWRKVFGEPEKESMTLLDFNTEELKEFIRQIKVKLNMEEELFERKTGIIVNELSEEMLIETLYKAEKILEFKKLEIALGIKPVVKDK